MAAPKKGEKASKNTSCSEETVFMFRPSNLRCIVCPFGLLHARCHVFLRFAESDGVGREGKRLLVKNAERKWRPSVIAPLLRTRTQPTFSKTIKKFSSKTAHLAFGHGWGASVGQQSEFRRVQSKVQPQARFDLGLLSALVFINRFCIG